jgi:uncharacterized protein YeeX (DUF496 family)
MLLSNIRLYSPPELQWPGYPNDIWVDPLSGIVHINRRHRRSYGHRNGTGKRIALRENQKRIQVETAVKAKETLRKGMSACSILSEHHNLLKDDPDRLSTTFIKQLSGIKGCEEVPE